MSSYSVDDVSRLEDDLLSGYKVSARPAEKTFVSLSMLLSNVLELVSWRIIVITVKLLKIRTPKKLLYLS